MFNCHKFGHNISKCHYDINDVEERANYVDKEEGEEPTLMLALKDDERDDRNSWYLDNGASNHICGYKKKFMELDKKVKGNASFRDTSKVQIEGNVPF